MKESQWDRRIQRADELAERFSHAAEILAFYGQVLEFQRTIYDKVSAHPRVAVASGGDFHRQLDAGVAIAHLPALLSLVENKGTAKLKQEAAQLASLSSEQQRETLENFLSVDEAPHTWFARVLFQPCAEWLAEAYPPQPTGSAASVCPICGARPQAAVLHPEGDGGKRFLLCSFCLREWEFRRILCPICGEESHQKLPRYSAEEIEAVRVEACDTCRFYLKSIDLTIDGRAVPVVDEVATVTLDLWATEHGYKKAEPNLMGF